MVLEIFLMVTSLVFLLFFLFSDNSIKSSLYLFIGTSLCISLVFSINEYFIGMTLFILNFLIQVTGIILYSKFKDERLVRRIPRKWKMNLPLGISIPLILFGLLSLLVKQNQDFIKESFVLFKSSEGIYKEMILVNPQYLYLMLLILVSCLIFLGLSKRRGA